MITDIHQLNGKRMSCTKYCEDHNKQIKPLTYYDGRGKWGPYDYRYAMFTLDHTSDYEAVPLFVNLYETSNIFNTEYLIKGSKFHWGKCGESIFLTLDKSTYHIPLERFCELYYHDGGQTPNELMKNLPRT